ncbi:hypothetical protein SAMN02745866_00329 [Alteromonadaceae bacterium Bs31]|nr:hypothetical protein SAMN02745866_00329 [Alteromonadaceae bacterium Bs31]
MNIIVTFILFLSVSALAIEKPANPLGFELIEGYKKYDGNKSYYCHLNSVYIGFSSRYYEDYPRNTDAVGGESSKAIVWNHEANRPYRCKEFIELREKLMSKYALEHDEYERLKPKSKPIGPRKDIR